MSDIELATCQAILHLHHTKNQRRGALDITRNVLQAKAADESEDADVARAAERFLEEYKLHREAQDRLTVAEHAVRKALSKEADAKVRADQYSLSA